MTFSIKKLTAAGFALTLGLSMGCLHPGGENANHNDSPDPSTCRDLDASGLNGGVTLDGRCFNITGRPTVNSGNLVIPAGTTLYFEQDGGINIEGDGSLTAEGTEESPIRLLGRQDEIGYWRGIQFLNTPSSNNRLVWVTVANAGASPWHGGIERSQGGVVMRGDQTRLQISNSTFRRNEFSGVSTNDTSRHLTLESSHFEENDGPILTTARHAALLSSDLTFSNNERETVRITEPTLDREASFAALEIPYEVRVRFNITAAVSIDAGASFVFGNDQGISVSGDGSLSVNGTEEEPVVMSGMQSDAGFWRGIEFDSTRAPENRLRHLIIEHAGSTAWHGGIVLSQGAVIVRGGSRLAIEDTTFADNEFSGLSIHDNASEVTVTNSHFADHPHYPIRIRAEHIDGLRDGNSFADNADNFIRIVGAENVVSDATWRAFEAPYRFMDRPTIAADVTVSPGTTLVFEVSAGLDIGEEGTFNADATGSDTIVFRGVDSSAQGYWRGLQFNNSYSTNNRLNNVEIRDGGRDAWHGGIEASRANLVVRGFATVELNDATVSHSGHYGISVHGDSASITGCSNVGYSQNASDDVNIAGGQACQ